MSLFRSLVFCAVFAGGVVGVLASAMHIAVTVPLILQAETFESSGTEEGHAPEHDHPVVAAAHEHSHVHVEEGTAGPIALSRNMLTVVAMLLAYFGFALLLTVSAEITGGLVDLKSGPIWGIAGFVVFSLVPAIGLPPELPGMPSADLALRQMWWIAAVASAAFSLWLAFFTNLNWRWPIAAIIVALPFGIGAPQPMDSASEVPTSLHFQFVASTMVISFISWQILGVSVGWLRARSSTRRYS